MTTNARVYRGRVMGIDATRPLNRKCNTFRDYMNISIVLSEFLP
jgi:hypothetical protein